MMPRPWSKAQGITDGDSSDEEPQPQLPTEAGMQPSEATPAAEQPKTIGSNAAAPPREAPPVLNAAAPLRERPQIKMGIGPSKCTMMMSHPSSKQVTAATLFEQEARPPFKVRSIAHSEPALASGLITAAWPQAVPSNPEPWCMPVLRTEARLRLGDAYITATAAFFDACAVPPAYLDEAVEAEALRLHGTEPTRQNLETYRCAARALPARLRAEVFFLRANDLFFRPCIDVLGRRLQGPVRCVPLKPDDTHGAVQLADVLGGMPRALLVASTSS